MRAVIPESSRKQVAIGGMTAQLSPERYVYVPLRWAGVPAHLSGQVPAPIPTPGVGCTVMSALSVLAELLRLRRLRRSSMLAT